MMLRPSDVSPKAVTFDPDQNILQRVIFKRDMVHFNDDGSAKITMFGIKNDSDRAGFEVLLPGNEEAKLDPVKTRMCYI